MSFALKSKALNHLASSAPYGELDFNTNLDIDELNTLRKRLQENIGFINYNKQRVRNQEFTQLMNFHQMALNTLNNMVTIKKVEYNNPYNQNVRNYQSGDYTRNGVESGSTNVVYYDSKGRVQTVNYQDIKKREEWEGQFDQNLINPPCYMLPPTGCFKPKKM